MRESAQIYDVRMAQFVLKIEKLSHIMVPRGSQYLRSPSPIMAPVVNIYPSFPRPRLILRKCQRVGYQLRLIVAYIARIAIDISKWRAGVNSSFHE